MNERKQTQTQRFGVLPKREAMKMCPEFIFKTRKIGLCYVQVLKSVKDFIVHIYLLPLLSAESTLTLTLSPCKIQDSATALCIFHDHTKFNQNEQFFWSFKRYYGCLTCLILIQPKKGSVIHLQLNRRTLIKAYKPVP